MNLKRPLMIAALTAVLATTVVACGDDDNAASDTTEVVTTEAAVETTQPATPTEAETTMPDTVEPATSGPATSGPGDCPEEPTEESADELLVGLTEDQATDAAEACGWIVRVVRLDGEDQPATMDLRTNRVNVEVTDGAVTAIVSTG